MRQKRPTGWWPATPGEEGPVRTRCGSGQPEGCPEPVSALFAGGPPGRRYAAVRYAPATQPEPALVATGYQV